MYKLKIASLLLSCTLLFTGCSFLPWGKEDGAGKSGSYNKMSDDDKGDGR